MKRYTCTLRNVAAFVTTLTLLFTSCGRAPEPIITTDEDAQQARPAPTTVIYECNERLFAETDAFKAIEAYIPELERMGVNVLWLMPVHPRGADDKAIGSPYCVKDYRAVDPAFGTIDDLKHLVTTAHDHGMQVILDWIANHTSWDNAWVTRHPDWYQGPATADEQGWKDVTFLNYSNQAVRDTMQDCMLYWVREADIDGFRCDYAGGAPLDFWSSVNNAVLELKPDAVLLAETSDARHYDAGFQLLYSWNFLYAIEDLYAGAGTWSALISAHRAEYNTTPDGKERLRYITTHDESAEKAPASSYRDAAGELSAFCLTAFMGGVPMIYSSQELGNTNTLSFFEYHLMDFTSPNSTRNAIADILRVWKETADLRAGEKTFGSLAARVPYIEYNREGQQLLVICNASNSEQQVKMPMRYEGLQMNDRLSGKTLVPPSVFTLAPREYRIYTR